MANAIGTIQESSNLHTVGYYSSWKVYSTCKIEEINASLYTILIYAFAGLHDNGTIKSLDEWADISKGGYVKFARLKQENPALKTLLAIGGWNEGSRRFSDMVQTKKTRRVFIESTLEFLETYGFDGIDLDWEYPTKRGGKLADRENLSLLIMELRREFDARGYLLTMAVISGASSIDSMYEVSALSRYLNYILVMTYDMHSSADGRTGHNSPLRSNDSINVEFSIKSWISKGANPAKMILGVGAYGKSFTLSNEHQNFIGAPSKGPGHPGPYSKANGTLYYYEVLNFIRDSGWIRRLSEEQQVPYAYFKDQWVGHDDVQSIEKKLDFAVSQNLGGIMLWSVDMDDPRGIAGSKFPLTKAIHAKLHAYANCDVLVNLAHGPGLVGPGGAPNRGRPLGEYHSVPVPGRAVLQRTNAVQRVDPVGHEDVDGRALRLHVERQTDVGWRRQQRQGTLRRCDRRKSRRQPSGLRTRLAELRRGRGHPDEGSQVRDASEAGAAAPRWFQDAARRQGDGQRLGLLAGPDRHAADGAASRRGGRGGARRVSGKVQVGASRCHGFDAVLRVSRRRQRRVQRRLWRAAGDARYSNRHSLVGDWLRQPKVSRRLHANRQPEGLHRPAACRDLAMRSRSLYFRVISFRTTMAQLGHGFVAAEVIASGRITTCHVAALRAWLKETTLPDLTDEQLVLFSLSCRNDYEGARRTIVAYVTMKNEHPTLFSGRRVLAPDLRRQLDVVDFCVLPMRTAEDYVLVYHGLHDTHFRSYDMQLAMKLLFMTLDAAAYDSPPQGLVMVFDMKGVGLLHLTRVKFPLVKAFFGYLQEALPLRLIRIHVLNSVYFLEKILDIIRPFVKAEVMQLITFHPCGALLDELPQAYLPKDIGGDLPEIRILHEANIVKLQTMQAYFEAEEAQREIALLRL